MKFLTPKSKKPRVRTDGDNNTSKKELWKTMKHPE